MSHFFAQGSWNTLRLIDTEHSHIDGAGVTNYLCYLFRLSCADAVGVDEGVVLLEDALLDDLLLCPSSLPPR